MVTSVYTALWFVVLECKGDEGRGINDDDEVGVEEGTGIQDDDDENKGAYDDEDSNDDDAKDDDNDEGSGRDMECFDSEDVVDDDDDDSNGDDVDHSGTVTVFGQYKSLKLGHTNSPRPAFTPSKPLCLCFTENSVDSGDCGGDCWSTCDCGFGICSINWDCGFGICSISWDCGFGICSIG